MASNRELSQLASLLEVADFELTQTTTIETFSATKYRSTKMTVQITQGTDYQLTELLLLHDGTTPTLFELASIASNDFLVTFSAVITDGNVVIDVDLVSGSSATAKVVSQRTLS